MTRTTDLLNRVAIFSLGIAMLALGALTVGLYFDVAFAQHLVDELRPHEWHTIPDSPWFLPSVGGIGVMALLLGGLGLVKNLQRHRVGRVSSSASTPQGAIDFDLSEVADAAAQSFAPLPKVIRARAKVQRASGKAVMVITIDADASVGLNVLTEHASQVERDLLTAIRDTPVEIAFQFHVAPVER